MLTRTAPHNMPKVTASQLNKAPVIVHDFETPHYQDMQHFKTYAEKIKAVMAANGEPMTVGAIHRALGDDADRRMTLNALDYLGTIRARLIPERYRLDPVPPRVIPKREWQNTLMLTKPKNMPYAGLKMESPGLFSYNK